MADLRLLTDIDTGEQFYPYTHEKAVLDDNGKPALDAIKSDLSEVNEDLANLYNGFDFEWTSGYYKTTDGIWRDGGNYYTSKKLPFSIIPDFVLPFLTVNTNGIISLWSGNTYVGYYLYNGTFYTPSGETVDTLAFNSIAISFFNTERYKELEFPSIINTVSELDLSVQSYWKRKQIAFLGDSITYGAYTAVGGNGSSEAAEKPYWYIANEILGGTVHGVEGHSYGVSGTSISSTTNVKADEAMSVRYSNMDDNLDLIVVLGGTNDYGTNVELGTIADTTDISFYGALDVLCNGLISKYPNGRIVFITPILRNWNGEGEGANDVGFTVDDYRKAIYDVASGKYGLAVIDGKMLGISPYNPTWSATYIYDGVHPNPIGHEIMGKNLARMLNAI